MNQKIKNILESQSMMISAMKPPGNGNDFAMTRRTMNLWFSVAALAVFSLGCILYLHTKRLEIVLLVPVIVLLMAFIYFSSKRNMAEHEHYEAALHGMALELETRNKELKKLVQLDPLTQLLNRRGLERALGIEVKRAQRNNTTNIAILVDCDDFKQINEALGHAAGDTVLQEMAKRIKDAVRPIDHVSRIGGDEFIILLCEIDMPSALLVTERIRLAVASSPILVPNGTAKITASFGAVVLPPELCTIEEILSKASSGLKQSKLSGKNAVSVAGTNDSAPRSNDLKMLLEKLINSDALRTVQAPIIRLSDQQLMGYQLSCRAAAGPFEMPESFFRAALENNMLTTVDLKCLRTALIAVKELKTKVPAYIKLFPSTVLDIPIEDLKEMLVDQLEGRKLCLEISERQFFGDPVCLMGHIEVLKEHGVQIGIDVGFGHSSVESLIIWHPDFVKIDPKLIKDLGNNPARILQLKRLKQIAEIINAHVIADGVDSAADIDVLKEIGIDLGQGAYWGPAQDIVGKPFKEPQSTSLEH